MPDWFDVFSGALGETLNLLLSPQRSLYEEMVNLIPEAAKVISAVYLLVCAAMVLPVIGAVALALLSKSADAGGMPIGGCALMVAVAACMLCVCMRMEQSAEAYELAMEPSSHLAAFAVGKMAAGLGGFRLGQRLRCDLRSGLIATAGVACAVILHSLGLGIIASALLLAWAGIESAREALRLLFRSAADGPVLAVAALALCPTAFALTLIGGVFDGEITAWAKAEGFLATGGVYLFVGMFPLSVLAGIATSQSDSFRDWFGLNWGGRGRPE